MAITLSGENSGNLSQETSAANPARPFLTFPKDFLWGTATSTTQIEGNIQNEWAGFVAADRRTCHPACDSYHRYREDIEWMKRLHVSTYRMGIEWSRLES